MGLFGFKNKKEKQGNTVNDVFKQFNQETNENIAPERQSRKQQQAQAQAQQASENKKENILEKLGILRKKLYTAQGEEFADYLTRVEDIIQKLKGMEDNTDLEAMQSVDNFIMSAVNNGVNYCNRNSWIGMGACIDLIDNYVNDRFYCGAYYKDADYCKFKLEGNKLYVDVKNKESELIAINERGRALLEKAKDPKYASYKSTIATELNTLKTRKEALTKQIDSINARNEVINKSISAIEQKFTIHADDDILDLQDKIGDVIEMQRENDSEDDMIEKFNQKLSENHRKISDNSLSFEDEAFGTVEEKPADINLDDFDFS